MCTIIVVNHHHKDLPLVIAANRDEVYDRPSSPVQILSREPHLILGAKDEFKGGTWLGVNKHSIFAAITNQGQIENPKLESRGKIVLEALKCKTLDEIISFVEDLNPSLYNNFNIVFGNNKNMFVGHSYLLHSMVIKELPKGVHIISNDIKFNGESAKSQYIHKRLDGVLDSPWLDYYKNLKKTLATSDYNIKIKPKKKNGKLMGYCTRSSSILAFSEDGLIRYKFHDRTEPRPKRNEGDPFIPRYKDYIDIWRNPDTVSAESSSEESVEDDDGEDDLSPKEAILNLKNKISLYDVDEFDF